jgi:hypothetical protein
MCWPLDAHHEQISTSISTISKAGNNFLDRQSESQSEL